MRRLRVLLVVTLVTWLGGCSTSPGPIVHQVGSLPQLAAGGYDGTVRLSELRFGIEPQKMVGLGTFDALDGEMIVLDGVIYRVGVDGRVNVMGPDQTTPFANVAYVTDWRKLGTTDGSCRTPMGGDWGDWAGFRQGVLALLPDRSRVYVLRIEGDFNAVTARSVPRQSKPYKPLADVVKSEQAIFHLKNVTGTIVGFYFPPQYRGVNVDGLHLHFLTDDRSRGGHVLSASPACGKQGGVTIWAYTDDWAWQSEQIDFIGPKPAEIPTVSDEAIRVIEQGK